MVTTLTSKSNTINDLQPSPKHRFSFKRLSIFLLWQLIAILFVELTLSFVGLGEEETFKIDPELGTKHLTNKRITWRQEGFAQSYFDADGMREPGLTIAKPPNTYRIALQGDSIVEGLQVPIEQTFGQVLQRKLNKVNGKHVQVLNFGTSGYSTVQEYLQLKKQVLRYKPDLVVLCYNSRDMFENWSPPDSVLTNVRPLAIHLPKGKLLVSNGPVLDWLRSPRAQFLTHIEWIRQNSHIWGLLSAVDMDMSLHDPIYKAIVGVLSNPRKGCQELTKVLTSNHPSGPSWHIQTFENKRPSPDCSAKPESISAAVTPVPTKLISAARNESLSKSPLLQSTAKSPEGNKIYVSVINRTLSSLLGEMKKECNRDGVQFAVIGLPVRAQLCPVPGLETCFDNIDYTQELAMLTKICQQRGIPMYNGEFAAEKLSHNDRVALYYAVHLSPNGHKFLAGKLEDFLAPIIQQPQSITTNTVSFNK